ncbi:hypothetical protein ACFLVC_04360 [Chloroflexota bacterium]
MKALTLRNVVTTLLLVFIMVPLGISGCGIEFESLALEILEEWADEHDINPTTAGGAANLARRAVAGSTGDEEADAAIGLGKMVSDIRKGDRIMEEARRNHDAAAMDAAIELRPNDWSYHNSRAAIALEENDLETAKEHYARALQIVDSDTEAAMQLEHNRGKGGRELNHREKIARSTQITEELESSEFLFDNLATAEAKWVYYRKLYNEYYFLGEDYADAGDKAQSELAFQQRDHYNEISSQLHQGNQPESLKWR